MQGAERRYGTTWSCILELLEAFRASMANTCKVTPRVAICDQSSSLAGYLHPQLSWGIFNHEDGRLGNSSLFELARRGRIRLIIAWVHDMAYVFSKGENFSARNQLALGRWVRSVKAQLCSHVGPLALEHKGD